MDRAGRGEGAVGGGVNVYQGNPMYQGKPIIGIVGGIGSGKSFVAELFAPLGGVVLKADEHVLGAYRRPEVLAAIGSWWGSEMITAEGEPDRKRIAERVFSDPEARKRLEGLIHPLVAAIREERMAEWARDPAVKAFIWDVPLLYEVGLDKRCDAVVFVECPLEIREQRVQRTRGWGVGELVKREKSQLPLDKKRSMAQYIVYNSSDAANSRRQVEAVFSRILSETPNADPANG